MPLIRLETRTKPARSETAPPPPPAPARQSGSGVVALAAGALFGLLLVAGATVFMVRRSRAVADAPPPAALDETGTGSTVPLTDTEGLIPLELNGSQSTSGEPTPDPALTSSMGPASINPEYNLEDVIANVNGETIAMRDLDRAVRVARVLGALSGDVPPANGDPALRDFQIKMLRRLIDLELMRQGAKAKGLIIPGGGTAELVTGYLEQVDKTDADLRTEMAANAVTDAELDRWFRNARTANFFVVNSLLVGRETEDRETVTSEWLATQWDTQAIDVNFYEP